MPYFAYSKYWSNFVLPLFLFLVTTATFPDFASAETSSADVEVSQMNPIVLVHSFSGRTQVMGKTIANLFDGKVVKHTINKTGKNFQANIKNYNTVYFGFPIWGNTIQKQARKHLEKMDLEGKNVVLFYSYLHHVDQANISKLIKTLAEKGAKVFPPVALRLDMHQNEDEIERLTTNMILKRKDLWSTEETYEVNCKRDHESNDMTLCNVPKGYAWVYEPSFDTNGLKKEVLKRVYVDTFDITKSEITIAQYEECVKNNECKKINTEKSFCRELVKSGDKNLPQPCVSPENASQFCSWNKMRLPSNAEWTRAARGELSVNFPWGNKFDKDGSLLNKGESQQTGFKEYSISKAESFITDGYKGLAPVCSFAAGDSPFGVCDMVGNISEYVVFNDNNKQGYALIGGSWLEVSEDAFKMDAYIVYNNYNGFYLSGFRCVK